MITLNGITLPDLYWQNRESWTGVETRVAVTLGGNKIISTRSLQARPIDLVGGPDFAWINRATLVSLQALAQDPNGIYVLDFEGDIFNVRFRHEDGAIAAEALTPRPNAEDTDWFGNVAIKLEEI